MRYGIEKFDDVIAVYVSPTLDDNEYSISDVENTSKQYTLEKDIESIPGYSTDFEIDGSAENTIFIVSTKSFSEIEELIVSNLKHTLVSNDKHLKKLSREAKSESSSDTPIDLETYEGLKKYLETQKYTIKKAKELLNTETAKNHLDLIAIVLDKIFMKYSTEEKFFKSIEWLSDFDLSNEIESIIEYRSKAKDGYADDNKMSTILSRYVGASSNVEVLEKIKDKLEPVKNDQFFSGVYEDADNQIKILKDLFFKLD